MRALHYGDGVIRVSFSACAAVFDYAVALANAGRSDRVSVPVDVDGRPGFSNLLLGPATQLYCTAAADDAVDAADPMDAEFVAELARRTARLTAPGRPVQPSDRSYAADDLDFE